MFAGIVVLLAGNRGAYAGPLNLNQANPNVGSGFIQVDYDAGSDAFSAIGFAQEFFENDGDIIPDFDILNTSGTPNSFGGFEIHATIDGAGNFSSGTISITGQIPGLGLTSGTLLTGDLVVFGFAGDIFEFVFNVTGGDLAPLMAAATSTVGTILSMGNSGFNAGFVASFSNEGQGLADTFAAPEPASMAMWGGLSALGLILSKRRNRKQTHTEAALVSCS